MESIAEDPEAPLHFITSAPRLRHEPTSALARARAGLALEVRERCERHDCLDIEAELVRVLDDFFDGPLASAVQERETKYLNTMTEVFRDELRDRTLALDRIKRKCTLLEARQAEADAVTDGLRTSLDRRNYEMDAMRKNHYKEILMLRELVTRQKTDPTTLRALDEALAGLNLNRRRLDMAKLDETARRTDSVAADEPTIDDRLELMKQEAEKRKQFIFVLRQDRDKWEERAHDALKQLEAMKSVAAMPREMSRVWASPEVTEPIPPWWALGDVGGRSERLAIDAAVVSNTVPLQSVAAALVEVLALPTVWTELAAILRDPNATSEASIQLQTLVTALAPAPPVTPERPLDARVFAPQSVPSPPTRNGSRVPCLHCNGLGIVDPMAVAVTDNNADVQLQRSLQRLMELKAEVKTRQDEINQLRQDNGELRGMSETLQAQLAEVRGQLAAVPAHTEKSTLSVAAPLVPGTTSIAVQTDVFAMEPPKPARDANRTKNLEELLRDQSTLVSDLQSDIIAKTETIRGLQESVEAAEANVRKMHQASANSQQLLRQEITVLNDALSVLREESTAAMRDRQAALSSYLATLATQTAPPPGLGTARMALDITKLIPWSDDDSQAELLAHMTESAAQQAQQEWLELQQAQTAEVETKEPILSREDLQASWFETIVSLRAALELQRESGHKLVAVQTQRIVTLSSHLARLAREMVAVRKRLMAEAAFWKTECEKTSHEQNCLVTEFNCYKTNFLVQGEVLKMRSLADSTQEQQWSTVHDDIQDFSRTLERADLDEAKAWFRQLTSVLMTADEDSKRPGLDAVTALFKAWKADSEATESTKHTRSHHKKRDSKSARAMSIVVEKSVETIRNLQLLADHAKAKPATPRHASAGSRRTSNTRRHSRALDGTTPSPPASPHVKRTHTSPLTEDAPKVPIETAVVDETAPELPVALDTLDEESFQETMVLSLDSQPQSVASPFSTVTLPQEELNAPQELKSPVSSESATTFTVSRDEVSTTAGVDDASISPHPTYKAEHKSRVPVASENPTLASVPIDRSMKMPTAPNATFTLPVVVKVDVPEVVEGKAPALTSAIKPSLACATDPAVGASTEPSMPSAKTHEARTHNLLDSKPASPRSPSVRSNQTENESVRKAKRVIQIRPMHLLSVAPKTTPPEVVASAITVDAPSPTTPSTASAPVLVAEVPSKPPTDEKDNTESNQPMHTSLTDVEPALESLSGADPVRHAKGMNYLRILARTRKDVVGLLSVLNWDVLVGLAALKRLQARLAEIETNHPHHAHQGSKWSGITFTIQEAVRAKKRQVAQTAERRDQMRSHLAHTNLAIIQAIAALFSDEGSNQRVDAPHHRFRHRGPTPLDMSLVDLSSIPPTQQIPTPHFPVHPHYPVDPYTGLVSAEADAPLELTQRFPVGFGAPKRLTKP
ncbi:hypothetical protein ACHHYP_04712 [Achlya hypogyna]|uniref:Uncharacterized protein n=1 Tax=Achlya hypogyna TaxID=1202772 RepID=A0A1V9Z0J6_ACHHY|nr:hypothetical protein ACHHYP_04712 [Achlya hypogyna]